MDKSCKDKLMACRTYAEAKPILETAKVSLSAHELAHTAFAIQEKQPELAKSFMQTIIQEASDLEVTKRSTDSSEIKEVDGGTSHLSSSITGLEKIGEEHDAPEAMQKQYDPKDQMGVSINETWGGFGGMPPQQPPMGGGMPPTGMQPMGQPRPPMPPQAQQMMQYTINEAVRIIAPKINKIIEAIQALDKKVQETVKGQVNSLEVGDKIGVRGTHSNGSFIRETVEGDTPADLSVARTEISRMNDALNSGVY